MSCRHTILLLWLLVACTPQDNQGNQDSLDGRLLSGSQGLLSIELSSGKVTKEFPMDSVSVENLSLVNADRLLLSLLVLSPTNRRDRIVEFNRRTKSTRLLAYGRNARSMPFENTVIYYNESGQLAKMSLENPEDTSELIDETQNTLPPAVVPIADDQFLYESKRDGHHEIWLYNMKSGISSEVKALENCSLVHAIWRSKTGELLCSERKQDGTFTGKYMLATLAEIVHEVDFGSDSYWPILYIADDDAAVLQQRTASVSGGERYPVWLYDFSTGTKDLLAEDVMLSTGTIYVR